MKTVEVISSCITEVKRSKFIAQLVPIDTFEGLQEKLKKEHPKASHVVYALRYLNTYEQVVENFSDDGEPKGCAGMPSLTVLRGEELINCAVVIVRYFGGIKLGTGGMARAYAKAVKEVIVLSNLLAYEKQIAYRFVTSYSMIDKTLYALKQLGMMQYERAFNLDHVQWEVFGNIEQIEQCKVLYPSSRD